MFSWQTRSQLYVTHRYNSEIYKLRWFPEEAGYSAEKGYTDINLSPLMSYEEKNISGSLILDLRKMMTSRASQEYADFESFRTTFFSPEGIENYITSSPL